MMIRINFYDANWLSVFCVMIWTEVGLVDSSVVRYQ